MLAWPWIAVAGAAEHLDLAIETPRDGAWFSDPGKTAFVAGRVRAHSGPGETLDLVFVVDRSESTRDVSGGDVNGDGRVERACEGRFRVLAFLLNLVGKCPDSADSIFRAELTAVSTLLDQLNPHVTHAGLVSFSGDGDDRTEDASVVVPLTTNYSEVRRGLGKLDRLGPVGLTNMKAGIDTASRALAQTHGEGSDACSGARKIMLFLTDGSPTLPKLKKHERRGPDFSVNQNRRLAVEAALAAAKTSIRIDTFGIGSAAFANPVALVEIARVTQGIYTPVVEPKNLISLFEQIDFSRIQELRVANRTTGARAGYQMEDADGSFAALVPLVEGKNELEVFVRTAEGGEASARLTVEFREGEGASPVLDPRLVTRRNRLLQNELSDVRERTLSMEAEHAERALRDLQLRIEVERKQAEERARKVRIEEERTK